MKCENCEHEIEEKTLIIKELGIEVDIKVTQKGKMFSELNIPKDKRLLRYNEVIELANSKYAKELKIDGSSLYDDFFFEQPFEFNKNRGYIARFVANSGWVRLDCNGDHRDSLTGLGVRFCRDMKTIKTELKTLKELIRKNKKYNFKDECWEFDIESINNEITKWQKELE